MRIAPKYKIIMDKTTRDFIATHINDDTTRLLLSANRYQGVDVPYCVEQIEARRLLRTKLPEWYACPDLVMSGRVPAEQCSSEQTARYKKRLLPSGCRSLCDLTGGMGVDFYYMSQGLERGIYCERQHQLCEAARHNFEVLGLTGCEVREGVSDLANVPDVDVIYLDPARRSSDGGRVFEISECEPDIVSWQDTLLEHCQLLITKVSPMADIQRSLTRLHNVTDVHVVAVKNECKEVLFVQRGKRFVDTIETQQDDNVIKPQIHCIDFVTGSEISFSFSDSELGNNNVRLASGIGKYLYEPDVTIMKTLAFGVLSDRYVGLGAFARDTHLFTSDEDIPDFPGRRFVVDEIIPFSSKTVKSIGKSLQSIVGGKGTPQANVATRNFPLTPEELRKRAGVRDGGDIYLFGALHNELGNVVVRCHKC